MKMVRFCCEDELFGDKLANYFVVFDYNELNFEEEIQEEFDVAVQEVIVCIFTCLNVMEAR